MWRDLHFYPCIIFASLHLLFNIIHIVPINNGYNKNDLRFNEDFKKDVKNTFF